MASDRPALRIVRDAAAADPQPAGLDDPGHRARGDAGELALVGSLFALNLVPMIGVLVRPGRWSPGLVGFATMAALLTGRELWSQVRGRRD